MDCQYPNKRKPMGMLNVGYNCKRGSESFQLNLLGTRLAVRYEQLL